MDYELYDMRKDTKEVFEDLVYGSTSDLKTVLFNDSMPLVQPFVVQGVMDALHLESESEALQTIKQLYKERLHKNMPRTVVEWMRHTTPSLHNKQNNFELCYAMSLDYKQTKSFFARYFLCDAFNVKNPLDAIYAYAFLNNKPYAFIEECLKLTKTCNVRMESDTSTIEIEETIFSLKDDEEFKQYLCNHCFHREQFYQRARTMIVDLLQKQHFLNHASAHDSLMGFNFQSYEKEHRKKSTVLPKGVVVSLPSDETIGRIVKGEYESYETLRKTLIIVSFYDFYVAANENCMESQKEVFSNLMDFYEEMDQRLLDCGFTPLYMRNPFDWCIIYCCKDESPIHKFYELNDWRFEEN